MIASGATRMAINEISALLAGERFVSHDKAHGDEYTHKSQNQNGGSIKFAFLTGLYILLPAHDKRYLLGD